MNISLQSIKAWVGEFFQPHQYVGVRRDTGSCLVANYIKYMHPRAEKVEVGNSTYQFSVDGKQYSDIFPVPVRELIELFDRTGRRRTRAQAQTVLKLIRKIEDEYGIQACNKDMDWIKNEVEVSYPEKELAGV